MMNHNISPLHVDENFFNELNSAMHSWVFGFKNFCIILPTLTKVFYSVLLMYTFHND